MDAVTKGFEGDVVRRAEKGDGGAQEELARFQLLAMKLQAAKSGDPVLGQLSQEEQVSLDVLQVINQFPESSAEAAQIAEQTQTRNRFAQARYIAERIVAQQRAKSFYDMYGPNKATISRKFYEAEVKGLSERAKKLSESKRSGNPDLKSGASAAIRAFRTALGFPEPEPAPPSEPLGRRPFAGGASAGGSPD